MMSEPAGGANAATEAAPEAAQQAIDTEVPPAGPDRLSRGLEKVGVLDWLMIALAGLHLLLLTGASSYTAFIPVFLQPFLVYADLAFSAVYAVEFLARLARANHKTMFVKTHWYDIVGAVPVANTGLRAFRLVRLLRMYVVLRLDWENEPTWITAFVRSVILRYLDILLSVITKPILLAIIKLVQVPLRKARFAALMGTVMDQQRQGIEKVTLMTMKMSKPGKQLADLGLTQKAVHVVTDAVMDQVVKMLKSDELNDLMADAVGDVLNAAAEGITGVAKAEPA